MKSETNADGFQPCSFEIVALDAQANLVGLLVQGLALGSLAYHRAIDGEAWQVSHIITGLTVGPDLRTEEDAQSLIYAVHLLYPAKGRFADSKDLLARMPGPQKTALLIISNTWIQEHGYSTGKPLVFQDMAPGDYLALARKVLAQIEGAAAPTSQQEATGATPAPQGQQASVRGHVAPQEPVQGAFIQGATAAKKKGKRDVKDHRSAGRGFA